MNFTENFSQVIDLFPFSRIENKSAVTEETVYRNTKNSNEAALPMEMPVNNYLKTPAEIEREFHQATDVSIGNIQKIKSNSDNSVPPFIGNQTFIIMHNADEILSGFMEENY
jgi:hypothetical protein